MCVRIVQKMYEQKYNKCTAQDLGVHIISNAQMVDVCDMLSFTTCQKKVAPWFISVYIIIKNAQFM